MSGGLGDCADAWPHPRGLGYKKLFPMKGRDEADGGNSPGAVRLFVKEAKEAALS